MQRLYLSRPPGQLATTIYSGVGHQVGVTRVCAGAALTLASLVGGDVCLVDANFRSPGLAQFFGIDNTIGFSDLITAKYSPQEVVRRLGAPNLYVMSAGSNLSNPTLALRPIPELYGCLMALRARFEYVLIDSAPINGYPDVSAIGPATDGVVVVVQANRSRRAAVARAVNKLKASNTRVLGTVLNQREYPIPEAIYRRF